MVESSGTPAKKKNMSIADLKSRNHKKTAAKKKTHRQFIDNFRATPPLLGENLIFYLTTKERERETG